MAADQHSYAFEKPSDCVRRIVIKPEMGYVVVKANSGPRVCGEYLEWDSGTKAIPMGRFYILQNEENFNGEWQRNGKLYEDIRSLNSMIEGSGWTLVADRKTAEKLAQDMQDYECQRMFRLWDIFNETLPKIKKGFDSDNWLNFINFVKLMKARKNERKH